MHLHTRAQERMSQTQDGPHCPHPGGSDNAFGCAEAKMKIPAVQKLAHARERAGGKHSHVVNSGLARGEEVRQLGVAHLPLKPEGGRRRHAWLVRGRHDMDGLRRLYGHDFDSGHYAERRRETRRGITALFVRPVPAINDLMATAVAGRRRGPYAGIFLRPTDKQGVRTAQTTQTAIRSLRDQMESSGP